MIIFQAGDVFAGRFRLDKRIGQGGMGQVWRATQLGLQREVALKLILPAVLDDVRFREMFLLEAQVSARLSDQLILTSDNPRTEDPDRIVRDILAGMRQPKAAMIVRDRRSAIVRALADASAGDIALIAGKGHEDYQIVGAERLPFSDRAIVRECLFSDRQDEAA